MPKRRLLPGFFNFLQISEFFYRGNNDVTSAGFRVKTTAAHAAVSTTNEAISVITKTLNFLFIFLSRRPAKNKRLFMYEKRKFFIACVARSYKNMDKNANKIKKL